MRSNKFFGLAVLTTYLFMCSFGPYTPLGKLQFRSKYRPQWKSVIPDFDCFNEQTGAMIGADAMAMSVIYMILFYHRMWVVGGIIAAADLTNYGLQGLGAPSVAALAALTML